MRKKVTLAAEAVKKVLLVDWDPIGVSDDSRVQDEYDSYVLPIVAMLSNEFTQEDLISYLLQKEAEMDLKVDRTRAERVASALSKISVHFAT